MFEKKKKQKQLLASEGLGKQRQTCEKIVAPLFSPELR